MAIRCLLILSLALPLWGKDLNPKDFPETLVVSEGRMETSVTGIKQDGMCADPQDDFSKGFCRAYGRKSTVQYESIGITIGTIGDTKYTLEGAGFFAPGTYHARVRDQYVDVLSNKHKNKMLRLRITGMANLAVAPQ